MGVLKERNEKEVRELEGVLVKKRKRVEKSRRLAEAQASYKALLEKMILDAMHQNVVYKEHLRQNQAATGVLKARLEFQRELCDKSEKKLHGKNKERGELEKQIGVVGGGVSSSRKRTRRRVSDDIDVNVNENLPPSSRKKKELREFLEEEQWAAAMAEEKTELDMRCEANYEYTTPVREDQNEIGKGNLEKWVQILFENAKEGSSSPTSAAAHGGNDAKCVEWNKNEWKRGRREIGRVGGRFRSVSPSPSVGSRGRSGGGVYCRSVLQFRN
ncbi:hypothetical protein ZOSMA_63G00660 [Zostera marina]|uniref:Uncharacterized protein n=1 Tax=Zostera marina TaxID=29655 RepID=A0A0K9NTJ2_ZOSMR|nr:hypothetical protein ZOSMA_63G00660 [Zostera marina]